MRAPRLFACPGGEYRMGDDGADDNNDFITFLESRRGGVTLPRALRSLVQDTLTETFEVDSRSRSRSRARWSPITIMLSHLWKRAHACAHACARARTAAHACTHAYTHTHTRALVRAGRRPPLTLALARSRLHSRLRSRSHCRSRSRLCSRLHCACRQGGNKAAVQTFLVSKRGRT